MAIHRHGPVLLVRVDGKSLTEYDDPRVVSFQHRELGDGGKEAKIVLADVGLKLLDDPSFQEGKGVEWRFGYRNTLSDLFQAKIFVTEPNMDAFSGLTLTVYAYDAIAQSNFVRRTTVWRDDDARLTHSEVVERIAAENGWIADVEPTKNYVTEIPQANMTDWDFLHDVLAPDSVAEDPTLEGHNYRVWLDNDNKTLHFRPADLGKPPKHVYKFMMENDDPLLISFRPKVNTNRPEDGSQEETTTAADIGRDGEIVNEEVSEATGEGTSRFSANYDARGTYTLQAAPDQADPANDNGHDPANGQAQVTKSEALLNHLEADITLVGDPTLRANDIISVWHVGQKFSGNYLIHELTQRIDSGGFVTEILGKKDALPVTIAGDGEPTGRNSSESGAPDTATGERVDVDSNENIRIVNIGEETVGED